jgi:aspartate kinase
MKKIKVAGLRPVTSLSQINVLCLSRRTDTLAKILAPLADNRINIEFLVTHSSEEKTLDLVLAVRRNDIAAALGLLRGTGDHGNRVEIRSRDSVGMISLFPHRNRPGVIGNFFLAFREAGIQVLAVNFSLSAISALVEEDQVPEALKALSEYFDLTG